MKIPLFSLLKLIKCQNIFPCINYKNFEILRLLFLLIYSLGEKFWRTIELFLLEDKHAKMCSCIEFSLIIQKTLFSQNVGLLIIVSILEGAFVWKML